MKKLLFLLLAVCGVYACTTPEEDAQIKLFWVEQLMQVMPKQAFPAPLPPQPLPAIPTEEEQTAPAEEQFAATPTETTQQTANKPAPATPAAKRPRVIKAMLFVSPTCPRCQRLKRDGWVAQFEDKYAGKISLTEYDLSIPKNEQLLQNMMRKHNLQRVAYPTLFIAGNVVQGYPLNADPVVKKVLANAGWDKVAAAPTQQFMEITIEDTRINKLKSNATLKDRQAMQRALERVKQSNQQALNDIGVMFDGDTQAQAFAIVTKSEKILMRTANTSNTYQNYLNAQRKILQEQETQLNQLMRQNAYKLRRIRG